MAIVTWDAAQKGTNVSLSGGNLTCNIGANQQAVRATFGRDPAAGGIWQVEYTVPGGSSPDDVRPGFAWVNAGVDMSVDSALMATTGAWVYVCGVHTIHVDGIIHNGDLGIDWSGDGGSGGTAFVAGLVYDAAAKTLKIYKNGVLKYTLNSVGSNGTLIYPAFTSWSLAGPGSMSEHSTVNFAGNFTYPITGANPYAANLGSGFFSVF